MELFTAYIRSFLGGNKEKLCFNLAKDWSVKQIANTFSTSYESRSNTFDTRFHVLFKERAAEF